MRHFKYTGWLPIFLFIVLVTAISMIAPKKKKIIFFGDSITEMGVKPGGYISIIDSILVADKLKDSYELIGAGISGNKVYDLFLRLENDVLKQKPDIVLIYVGINDIWHKRLTGTGTDFDKFGRFYEAIIAKLKQQKIQPIICTPAVIGEKKEGKNEQDKDLDIYSSWLVNYALNNNIPLVNLRQRFKDHIAYNNPDNKELGILTTDKVHLNTDGNKLVASEMWRIIVGLK